MFCKTLRHTHFFVRFHLILICTTFDLQHNLFDGSHSLISKNYVKLFRGVHYKVSAPEFHKFGSCYCKNACKTNVFAWHEKLFRDCTWQKLIFYDVECGYEAQNVDWKHRERRPVVQKAGNFSDLLLFVRLKALFLPRLCYFKSWEGLPPSCRMGEGGQDLQSSINLQNTGGGEGGSGGGGIAPIHLSSTLPSALPSNLNKHNIV